LKKMPLAPVARSVAKQTLQLPQGLAALPFGVSMDEIVKTFGKRPRRTSA
jgi:hypothetical protein